MSCLPPALTRAQRSLVNRLSRLLSPLPQPIRLPRHLLRRRRPQTDRRRHPPHNQAHPQAWHSPEVGPSGHRLTHRVMGRRGERGRSLWKSRQVSHKKPRPCQGHANRRETAIPTVPRRVRTLAASTPRTSFRPFATHRRTIQTTEAYITSNFGWGLTKRIESHGLARFKAHVQRARSDSYPLLRLLICIIVSPGRLSRDRFHPPSTSPAHDVRLIHLHYSFRHVVYCSGDLRATSLWQQHRTQARK